MSAIKDRIVGELPDDGEVALYAAAERVARAFHEAYERRVPEHGYRTREASAKPWADVPANNRALMISVVVELLQRAVIEVGPHAA